MLLFKDAPLSVYFNDDFGRIPATTADEKLVIKTPFMNAISKIILTTLIRYKTQIPAQFD